MPCRRRAHRRGVRSRRSRHWRTSSGRSWSSSRTNTSVRSGSTSQPSQLREHGPQLDRQRAGNVTGREVFDRAARRREPRRRAIAARNAVDGRARSSAGSVAVEARAAPVHLGQAREVGRERTRSRRAAASTKVSSSSIAQQRVRRALTCRSSWCDPTAPGAEQNDPAPWVGYTGRSSGSTRISVAQRAEQLSGEVLVRFGSEQIGSTDGADHQRTAAEQRDRFAVLDEEVGEMVGRVTRRRDRPENEPVTQLDLVAVRDVAVRDLEVRAARREERRAPRREFGAARHVVGVRVRVGRPARSRGRVRAPRRSCCVGQARRIDDERPAVAEIDEVATNDRGLRRRTP